MAVARQRFAMPEGSGRLWQIGRKDRQGLLRIFWGGIIAVFLFALFTTTVSSGTSILAAALIMVAAFYPAYLAASGKVQGIPIFPIYALSATWLYAFPVLMDHPLVESYPPDVHFKAALIVVIHLFAGTCAWYFVGRRPYGEPRHYNIMPRKTADTLLLSVLFAAALLSVGLQASWFGTGRLIPIDLRVLNILERLTFALVNLTVFLFAYRWGTRELRKRQRNFFIFCFGLYFLSSTTNLFLYNALATMVLFVIGFTLGRRRIPWLFVFVLLPLVSVLHYGKHEMRDEHWDSRNSAVVTPVEYPGWYAEWVGHGFENLPFLVEERDVRHSTMIERTSLMQLLLLVVEQSPHRIPYMYGSTYSVIPELLIPRVLYPERLTTQEGVRRLSIHYGLLNRESTEHTSIGWGLLTESMANFGIFGVILIGALIGLFYGQLSRITLRAPLLSFRSMFAFIVLGMTVFFEYSASIYVTSLWQTTVPLIILLVFFMKRVPSPSYAEVLMKKRQMQLARTRQIEEIQPAGVVQ